MIQAMSDMLQHNFYFFKSRKPGIIPADLVAILFVILFNTLFSILFSVLYAIIVAIWFGSLFDCLFTITIRIFIVSSGTVIGQKGAQCSHAVVFELL